MMTTRLRRLARQLHCRLDGRHAEAGITMVELLIAGAFTVVVLAVAGGLMISSMHVDSTVTRTSNMNSQATVLSRSLQQDLGNSVLVQTTPKPTDSVSDRAGVQYLSAFVTEESTATDPDAADNDQVVISEVTGHCKVWAYVPELRAVYARESNEKQTINVGTEGAKPDHVVDGIDGDDLTGWRLVAGGTATGENNPDVASIDPVEEGSVIFSEQEQASSVTSDSAAEQLSVVRLQYAISTQAWRSSSETTAISLDSRFTTGTALSIAGTSIRWDASASCLGSR